MAFPTLTTAEIAQLKKDQASAASAAAVYTAGVAAQQARAAQLAVTDGAFKKFFDYYNTNIIGKYDSERQALNGQYIASPITETDLINCASLVSDRITPTLPSTDIVRVAEFDGSPLVTNIDNETQHISDQSGLETALVSGYTATTLAGTVKTTTTISSGSTTMQLTDTLTYTIANGSIYVITDGTNLAVVRVVSSVLQVSHPPFITDCVIQVLVASGTVAITQNPQVFSGFSNSERTSKTASVPALQPLMNYLITQLQAAINGRISNLNTELTIIAANQDPDGTSELSTATTNVNTSKTFLTSYLVTTVISNTGITSLSTERGVRSPQITARITQITNAYTGRTENYFNRRYQVSNDRANTMRGSLRLQKAAESTATQSQTYASTLADQATAIGRLLP